MKSPRYSTLARLLVAGILSHGLAGCVMTRPAERDEAQPPVSAAAREAMSRGEPCYFRGEIDFCTRTGDEDGDGVLDDKDQCPHTPRGMPVDAKGCPLDSDGDGVPDELDQCPDTPKGAKVNAVGCWVLDNLHFQTGMHAIAPDSFPLLDGVVQVLRDNPRVRVEIQGHTDNVGTAAFNEQLSARRAAAVMNYLTGHGIAADRLTAIGLGLTQPVAANDDDAGRGKNRRVELKPLF